MMKCNLCKTGIVLSALTGLALPTTALADFVADGKVKLDLKNFYLTRSYDTAADDVGSWSQAADLQYSSGYTDTRIQVGLDASSQLAYIISADGDDGSVPIHADGEAPDTYGRSGATFKAKYSKTELTVGDHRPHLPIAWDDTSRQLDTIYEGAMLQSKEIDGLALTAGRYWEVVTRESSDKEGMSIFRGNDDKRSDGLDFLGASYDVTTALNVTYFLGKLNDYYKQQYAGLTYKTRLGDVGSRTDVRLFRVSDDGEARNGEYDTQAFGLRESLNMGNHTVMVNYQKMNNDKFFPTLNGYIPQPYLVQWSNLAFVRPDEKSLGLVYMYNAKDTLPGLKIFARMIKGTDIDVGGLTDENETEKNLYVTYSLQQGSLKGLTFDVRGNFIDRSFTSGYDEYRVTTTYTVNF
ncbi:OprD family outer membrane porin [Candidatus Thalassolituus haligoni]|uniref:OprD family outer membrane porin n=1 Tax=Candidatus Thalassolituus haligoni TaxID=3100113 RepID=UPI003512AB0A